MGLVSRGVGGDEHLTGAAEWERGMKESEEHHTAGEEDHWAQRVVRPNPQALADVWEQQPAEDLPAEEQPGEEH